MTVQRIGDWLRALAYLTVAAWALCAIYFDYRMNEFVREVVYGQAERGAYE